MSNPEIKEHLTFKVRDAVRTVLMDEMWKAAMRSGYDPKRDEDDAKALFAYLQNFLRELLDEDADIKRIAGVLEAGHYVAMVEETVDGMKNRRRGQ
jgi:hypothetical protein